MHKIKFVITAVLISVIFAFQFSSPAVTLADSGSPINNASDQARTSASNPLLYPGCTATGRDPGFGSTPNAVSGFDAGERKAEEYLPIKRWQGAAGSFHSRLDANAWGDIDQKASKAIGSIVFSLGHTVYGMGVEFVDFAGRFQVLCAVAEDADSVAATMGNALLGGGLYSGIVVFGLIVVIFRAAKGKSGSNPFMYLLRVAVVLGITAVMLNAANSNSSRAGSPGWIAVTTVNTINQVGGVLATSLIDTGTDELNKSLDADAESSRLSCEYYSAWMRNKFLQENDYSPNSKMVIALSSLWESTGRAAWRNYQFGNDNELGKWMDCRLLDLNTSIPHGDLRADLRESMVGHPLASDVGVRFFDSANSNTERDRWIFAWATCRHNDSGWQMSKPFEDVRKTNLSSDNISRDCDSWWKKSTSSSGVIPDAFNYTDNRTTNADETSDAPVVAEFLYHVHGNVVGSPLVLGVTYLLASIAMLGAFGAMSIALILAKIMLVAMLPLVFFVLFLSLWPTQRGQTDKSIKFFKYFVGAASFTLVFTFVLSLVALITSYVATAGMAAMGAGSLIANVWVGISPLLALAVVHMMFKTVGLPSPLSPASALGYAAVLGGGGLAIGAAAGGLVGNMAGRASGAARSEAGRWGRGTSRAIRSGAASDPTQSRSTQGGGVMPNAPEIDPTAGANGQSDGRYESHNRTDPNQTQSAPTSVTNNNTTIIQQGGGQTSSAGNAAAWAAAAGRAGATPSTPAGQGQQRALDNNNDLSQNQIAAAARTLAAAIRNIVGQSINASGRTQARSAGTTSLSLSGAGGILTAPLRIPQMLASLIAGLTGGRAGRVGRNASSNNRDRYGSSGAVDSRQRSDMYRAQTRSDRATSREGGSGGMLSNQPSTRGSSGSGQSGTSQSGRMSGVRPTAPRGPTNNNQGGSSPPGGMPR